MVLPVAKNLVATKSLDWSRPENFQIPILALRGLYIPKSTRGEVSRRRTLSVVVTVQEVRRPRPTRKSAVVATSITTGLVLTGWGFRRSGVEEIVCICCSSNPTGSSTRRTFPMNPSSTRIPNLWSGLFLINVIRCACKEGKGGAYQLAMLWHAASSMGPPWVKKAGPSVDINSVNSVGYGNWDKSTRDLCNVLGQNIARTVQKMNNLFVATLGRPILLLAKVRVAIYEPVVRKRPGTVIAEGIVFCVVGLPDAE